MLKRSFLLVLTLLAVFFEAVFTTLPVVLCLLTIVSIHEKSNKIFFLALLSGILLDTMRVDTIGLRSMFYIVFLFLVFLYERKFETETPVFVFVATFLGSLFYTLCFGQTFGLVAALVSSMGAVIVFFVVTFVIGKTSKNTLPMVH